MKTLWTSFSILLILSINIFAQLGPILQINQYSENELVVSVDEQIHLDYGLAYPLTYQINIPVGISGLSVYKKEISADPWAKIEEKTSDDFFNGIDAVRFDYDSALTYLSVAFGEKSDTIYIKVINEFDESVQISFQEITKYYDNRDAVVTSTADDWADYCDYKFVESCKEFRKRKMWLSTAIITRGCSPDTWDNIQTQLDSGYVEAIAHSRHHLHTPYTNNYEEVYGCKTDIIHELDLPKQFMYRGKEYVYVWVAPYGNYDDDVDDVVSQTKYLVSRMYTMDYHTLPTWESEKEKFESIGVSLEIGPTEIFGAPWMGTDDINVLNATFDSVTTAGNIYHAMIHPNTDVYLEDYFHQHLDYISGRKNIWYAATGHLYLYRMLHDHSGSSPTSITDLDLVVSELTLEQNYPNPFNPSTVIKYSIPNTASSSSVVLKIFDPLGREVKTLVNEVQKPGNYEVDFNAGNLSSGVYFYKLATSKHTAIKKMLLIR